MPLLTTGEDGYLMIRSDARFCGPRHVESVLSLLFELHLPGLTFEGIMDKCKCWAAGSHSCMKLKKDIELLRKLVVHQLSARARGYTAEDPVVMRDIVDERRPRSANACVQVGSFDREVKVNIARAQGQVLARRYFGSRPLDITDPVHQNEDTCDLVKLRNGKLDDETAIQDAIRVLDYRLHTIMATASMYRHALGVDFPDCEHIDVRTWHYVSLRGSGEPYDLAKWHHAYEKIAQANLFELPGEGEGEFYKKGEKYLAVVMVHAGWDKERIREAVRTLKQMKRDRGRAATTIKFSQLYSCPDIPSQLKKIGDAEGQGTRGLKLAKAFKRPEPAMLPEVDGDDESLLCEEYYRDP